MNTRIFIPVTLAVVTAGAGLFSFARLAEAARERSPQDGGRTFEFRLNGGAPQRWEYDSNGQPRQLQDRGVQDSRMEDLLRQLMEKHGNGGGGFPDDFFKQLDPGNSEDEESPEDRGNGPLNPRKLMEEMMRRMGGRGGNPDSLGFGPGPREEIARTSKHHLSAAAEWRPLVAQARQSTVRVLKKDRQVALATVVSADGYALTKASEVAKGDFEVEFGDGRIVAAKGVDEMKAYDLALIKVEATGLTAAKFANTETPVGTLIAAVSTGEDATGLGVISVAARSLDERSKGFLGIVMSRDQAPDRGVLIGKVVTGGAAERVGMQAGDIILEVNGQIMDSPGQLLKLVASLKPEQKVSVQILRDKEKKSLELSLGNRAQAAEQTGFDLRQLDQTAQMGSSLSKNASGYPNAVQSDLALQAEDAGGPVIDVKGNIVGLNIARAERVSTYLIPGKIVNALLLDVQTGKFALSKDADTLHSELREINSTITKAQEAMKKAEEERDAAMKALDKIQKK